jgi:type IV pilus assembly protein PilQ
MVKTMNCQSLKVETVLRISFALLALLFSSSALAVVMENIEFSSLPGDKTEIKMIFDGVPPDPSGYTIEQPARIALDLDGVRSGLSSKHHSLGSGNARSVTVVESDGRTRIIISMSELVGYSSRVSDNSLYILVGEDETGSGSVASSG